MLLCSDFAQHALKLKLYPKQAEILDSFLTEDSHKQLGLLASVLARR